jgi:hypothetical protein
MTASLALRRWRPPGPAAAEAGAFRMLARRGASGPVREQRVLEAAILARP